MSTDRDIERIVRSWMDEGVTALPDRVLDLVLDRIPATPQRRASWLARRFPTLSTYARYGLVAAAVVLAAVVGIGLFGRSVGGPPPSPSTALTPIPSPTPAPLPGGQVLGAGTYRVTVLGTGHATITVPAGWLAFDNFSVNNNGAIPTLTAVIFWTSDSDFQRVYADPCHWQAGYVDPPVGPSVDDLATALANQPLRGDSVPIEVSVGHYQGKMVELSVPSDQNFADCDAGEFRSWDGRFHQGPGQIDQIYILDVGGQRLVIDTFFMPGTSDADRAERQAIMDSIQIEGP
jgi:hypothetical protein